MLRLHNYWSSVCSQKVRICLAEKGLAFENHHVNLFEFEHWTPAYLKLNPKAVVPALDHDGKIIIESNVIIEYLDETHPDPRLLPANPLQRAHVRALAQSIACEIHPINNLRVLRYLSHELKVDEDAKNTWYRHWVRDGLEAFERQLAQGPRSTYCFGDTPTLADCCLVPQIFNGQRFKVNFDGLPLTMGAFEQCMKLEAFQRAQPSACPDFEP